MCEVKNFNLRGGFGADWACKSLLSTYNSRPHIQKNSEEKLVFYHKINIITSVITPIIYNQGVSIYSIL